MATIYLYISSIVSKDVADKGSIADLEKEAEKLRDKYPLVAPGWACLDGSVSVHGVFHDDPILDK